MELEGNNIESNNNNYCQIQNKTENQNNYKKMNELFKCLFDSNCLYRKALDDKIGEFHGNYSPCKIINLKWICRLKEIFVYKEDGKDSFIKKDIIQTDFHIFQNFHDLYPQNIENGEFFIVHEIFFISLYPYIKGLENIKDIFQIYEIF